MEQVDLSRLKTCASSAEVGYPGLAELYLEKTGDSAGTACRLCICCAGVVDIGGSTFLKLDSKPEEFCYMIKYVDHAMVYIRQLWCRSNCDIPENMNHRKS